MIRLLTVGLWAFLTLSMFAPVDSVAVLSRTVNYPVRLAYIDYLTQWWPPEGIAAGMGVPGYATNSIYNYFAFAFWSYNGPLDVSTVWANPLTYFGADSPFGKTKAEIQANLKKKYNDAGIKILVSAFGATEFPTTAKYDPIETATRLGNFVLANNLDGADIDWYDNAAMYAGTGEQWLITFTKKLRELLPSHTITHAPQGPYFKKYFYKNGAYITIHQAVGNLIDFYNVQFYNQGDTKYDTYDQLFISAGGYFNGTAVKEIVARKIPRNMLVVGKPVTPGDASNTGWMDLTVFGNAVTRAYKEEHFYAGVMFWQYSSDKTGAGVTKAAGQLKDMCTADKTCI